MRLILTYGVLPSLLRGACFRGILCAEYEENGIVGSAMAVSSLFFFLHFDLTALPVYLFAGMLLSLVLYMTRSSVAAMLVHLGYNLFGVLAQAGLSGYCRSTGNLGFLVVLLIALLLLSAAVFCGESARVLRRRARLRLTDAPDSQQTLRSFPHFPPVSFCPPSDVPSSAPKAMLAVVLWATGVVINLVR